MTASEEPRDTWVLLETVEGPAQAEILRGLLEAQEIPVMLSQEGAARFAYSVSVGPLAEVEVLVPSSHLEAAQQVIKDYWLQSFAAREEFEELDSEPPEDEDTAGDE